MILVESVGLSKINGCLYAFLVIVLLTEIVSATFHNPHFEASILT